MPHAAESVVAVIIGQNKKDVRLFFFREKAGAGKRPRQAHRSCRPCKPQDLPAGNVFLEE